VNEKGVPRPPQLTNWLRLNQGSWGITSEALEWFVRVWNNYPKVQTFSVSINPTSVNANTTSEQTFTVNGLSTSDIVFVNKPTHQTGLVVGGARVSAVDTIAITFGNITGLSIDPSSETYFIVAIRL
jgi:hypothetical protein